MPGWQVTAATIHCDAVDDEATLMVRYEDQSVSCAAYPRYGRPDKKLAAIMKKKGRRSGRQLRCEGPLCRRMTEYRDRLFAEAADEQIIT